MIVNSRPEVNLNSGGVAIVIPTHKQFIELTSNERSSLLQIKSVLGRREIFLVHPMYLDPEPFLKLFAPVKCTSVVLNNRYFGTMPRATELLLSPVFYNHFNHFDYLLIHHLDAFVFSDQLDYWCKQGIDYIGAPWIFNQVSDGVIQIDGVGNGGFSLRRVSAFQHIARNRKFVFNKMKLTFMVRFLQKIPSATTKSFFGISRIIQRYQSHALYEDAFWGIVVPRYFPSFKVGTPQQAISFSFESNPRVLYKLNNENLPFGCHAWERNDPEFWLPYIIQARIGSSQPELT